MRDPEHPISRSDEKQQAGHLTIRNRSQRNPELPQESNRQGDTLRADEDHCGDSGTIRIRDPAGAPTRGKPFGHATKIGRESDRVDQRERA